MRFVLYTGTIVYAIKRDLRVLVLSLLVLAVLYALYTHDAITFPGTTVNGNADCTRPTKGNPMANVLLDDYENDPTRPMACYYPTVQKQVKKFLDDTIPFDAGRSRSPLPKYQRNAAARQFVTMPVSTIPNAQTEFAEACYGKKFQPLCRDTPSACNPNMRGVQLEAFGGLDPSDNRRGPGGGWGGAV
tara:strand:- start:2151 stop:2714 length:564 start_codon:yes stop_codon:yes gene_type:complete